ncbi:MAG: M17 family peptidase N-terminal domain-containing protein, partial [Woeseia sp.]
MNYFTTSSAASRRTAGAIIVGIYERGQLGVAAKELDSASGGQLARLVKSGDVSGSLGKCAVLTALKNVRAQRVV